jgi:hypothetical protein
MINESRTITTIPLVNVSSGFQPYTTATTSFIYTNTSATKTLYLNSYCDNLTTNPRTLTNYGNITYIRIA